MATATHDDIRKDVHKALQDLDNLSGARRLFQDLNYAPTSASLPRPGKPDSRAHKALADDPQIIASQDRFNVIYCRLDADRLLRGDERAVISELLKTGNEYGIFLFSTADASTWDFVNVKYDKDKDRRRIYRRITVGPDERVGDRLRTASDRLVNTYVESDQLSALDIQYLHEDAFDVEKVTEDFFKAYRKLHVALKDDLIAQTADQEWAHEYAMQFMNRIMFLYFIQRKRWLGDDSQFIRTYWNAYRNAGQPDNSFYERWLKVLFFEAFNHNFNHGHTHFPMDIFKALAHAPYLNGGLFTANDLDRKHRFEITDAQFAEIFKLLESYNFTISEDSPLDQEVAVDPEMIGKVYESLVNVSDESDDQGKAGIFYTPRIEIDLMCRLALVDNLTNHLGEEHKSLLYEAVFALDEDEKKSADEALSQHNLWPELNRHISEITVLDPACGSGSFLVGMLRILDDLSERANAVFGDHYSAYDRRMRIIGRSLYGVDVKNWAVHIAELRLWLQLIVDTPFKPEELTLNPLLPNLTFKLRQGDSLVQEVGGINFAHLKLPGGVPPHLKGQLTILKGEKLKYFYNDPSARYRTAVQINDAELAIFKRILDARIEKIDNELNLTREDASQQSMAIPGQQITPTQSKLSVQGQQAVELRAERADIQRVKARLGTTRTVPFVWDIAFVEIFRDDKQGFDIVVGNPPYVRQEDIADPQLPSQEVTTENKKEYKAKLARSVYEAFSAYFAYTLNGGVAARS